MDIELIKLLQQTGFTEKEARVYLALLELGRADVTDIAKTAELKRSIVYVIVDELVEKGYATQLPGGKINTYQAADPGLIHNQIRTTSKHLGEMLPFLRSLQNKGESKPKLHYISNKEGILKTYYDIYNYNDHFFISSYWRLEQCFPGELDKWIEEYKRHKYQLIGRHLLPDSPKETPSISKLLTIDQKIRVLPEIEDMGLDFAIFGNKIAITSLEKEPFMILIESQEFVSSIMLIFEIAWRSGKEIR